MPDDAKPSEESAGLPLEARSAREFYVVGIGGSAGALSALRTLFSHMPPAPGIAFVVVVHLSPKHESRLGELLQPYSQMRVQQVTETIALAPNRVYVIPPNANLSAIDTHLRLSKLEERRIERAPIDHFLRTLAATHDGKAVSVILTGAGSDGALGLRQIKERNGLAIVQDPEEAEYDGMPRAAVATGMVDLVVPVRNIANEILRFCGTEPRLPAPDANDAIDEDEDAVLTEILSLLRQRMNHEFGIYKRATLLRRIRRRMQLRHADTLTSYLDALRNRPDEPRALANDLLIAVAEFFQPPDLFRALEENVLPHLFDLKPGSQGRLRVWSIGCSTGEEAYSLAMLLAEEAERREAPPELHVFASDLAEDMLKKAREGIYPLEAGATISPERLERFFTKEYGRYRVRRALRDIVVFSKHDMFSDPPFSHIDLIVCRNLLCDLQPEVRRAVLSLFYYALEPHGMLVLGSDDPIDAPHQFDCEHEGISLYVKKSGASQGLRIPVPRHKEARRLEGQAPPSLMDAARRVSDIHDRMIADHVPASVLIDAENHVIHYSPRASRYVHVPGGEPTHDFLKIVREPLRSKLRAAIDSVRGDRVPWKSEPFTIATEDGSRRIMVHIELANDARAAGMLLVVFKEVADYRKDQDPTQRMDAGEAISQVQVDLEQTNKRLRGMLASTDPRTPEEEADEHLGTILGELESSKAELQAVNEQLSTLDEENERRLHELAQLSADLQNLLESTGIPTLFLDTELRIVRFTHRAGELFHVRDTDVGRPLADLRHELVYDSLGADALRAVKHSTSVEREVVSATGRSYLARMLPCMVGQGNKGVVINLIDITERKEAEDELRNADRRKDEFIALLAHELRNPLAPISSGIEVLKSGVNDPRLVGQVSATMERQTKQLVRLVDDLLDLSRIRGGKLHLRKSLVTLADIIRDAISAVRPMIEHAQHELTVRLPDEPIMLDADSTRLTQVLANLLNNSARYTAEKGRIQITAERDGGNAIVIVKDNGQGISADALSHVFEMFYQAEDPPIAQSTGLGIGLTLAKTLVELHGGSISVSSEGKDRGSEVTLRLPIATAAARPLATVAEREDDLSGHRVLIVDDNVDAAETLRMLMDTLGDNDVRTASSGSEALKTAMEQRPDIVLLDLKMPEMDGYEVARHIRQEPWGADILLVAVTGWGLEAHKRRTQEAGFDRHLTKPANLAALKAVLGQRRAAQRFSEHRH